MYELLYIFIYFIYTYVFILEKELFQSLKIHFYVCKIFDKNFDYFGSSSVNSQTNSELSKQERFNFAK